MKIFKLTLLVFLIAFTTSTNAQDATNNATWEETVEFLTGFLPNFNHEFVAVDNKKAYKYYFKYKIIEKDKLHVEDNSLTDNSITKYIAPLNELKKVQHRNKFIELTFTGKFVEAHYEDGTISKTDFVTIDLLSFTNDVTGRSEYFSPRENINTQRLLKALTHLCFLANEKRKQNKF